MPLMYQTLIQTDMQAVDRVIELRLSSDVPLVSQVSQYIIAAGGKRLRPALLLLMCGALGYRGHHHHTMAAVVEFIHTATLLHDDVVDESTLRRGLATANETFGNAASVLVGDFLYSRAFQMMVDTGEMRILQTLADATNVIAEGEVLQLMNIHDPNLSPETYLHVIESKTAKLFEASCRIAAILAQASPEIEAQAAAYGAALGTAFQLIDDVLDYDGDPNTMGKNLGDDLREGKVTLPLIFAMQAGLPEEKSLIRSAIETGNTEFASQIAHIVRHTDALEKSRKLAQQQAHKAARQIQAWPTSEKTQAFWDALLQLPERSIHRNA